MTETATEHVGKTVCFHGFGAWLVLFILIGGGLFWVLRLLRKFIQGPFYRKTNRIDGRVVIITGCNTGIGKETALELARRGGRIYMACRDAQRCEAARLEIIEQTGNANVFNRSLDLSSLASVRNFARSFLDEEDRLDILINNAGIMATPYGLTIDNYEQQFAVNHLGHFLLTHLLLPRLKASAPSRIIVLSSIAYVVGRINKEDLNSVKLYTKTGAYAQSKLANLLFVRKLSELLKDTRVTVNAVHPGIVHTELSRYNELPSWLWMILDFLAQFVLKSPRAGAQTTLRLALDPNLQAITGKFYADCLPWPVLSRARDTEMANWLWTESEKMVGLRPRTANPNFAEDLGTVVVDSA